MSFHEAFTITDRREGGRKDGYVNDPDDRGGETYRGISRVHHPDWSGWLIIDAAKRNGTVDRELLAANEALATQVEMFYRDKFWNRVRGDHIPEPIAHELYDTAVNTGVGTAVKMLQAALNRMNRNQQSWPDITADGGMGPITLMTTKTCCDRLKGTNRLLKALNGEQYMHYANIVERTPSQEKYFNGWLERV